MNNIERLNVYILILTKKTINLFAFYIFCINIEVVTKINMKRKQECNINVL